MNSQLYQEISDLRQQNLQQLLTAIGVIMSGLIIASILPTLLLQFVYTDQAALMGGETPFWLQNGSLIIFSLSVLYFIYTIVMTVGRSRKIAMLKQQLAMVGAGATFSDDEVKQQEKELAALEKMVDEALEENKKPARSTRKPRSRSSKK